MKVLLFTGAVPRMPSGVGDYVGELCRALNDKVDLIIVTAANGLVDPALLAGATVYPIVKTWGYSDLHAIRQIIVSEKPDVFHQQYPSYMGGPTNRSLLSNFLPAWLKANFWSTPLVTTYHEFGERRLRWRARSLPNLILSDALITITSRDRTLLSRMKSKVSRIPIMSNIPARPDYVRRSHGKPRVAYFGFIEPLKGFERFIDIAALLGAAGFEFVVIGGFRPETDVYHGKLLQKVRGAGLEGVMRFMGHLNREEVADVLAGSDCCLLPFEEGVSERRGSFLAAVVQGTPVVTTEGPFTPEEYRNVPGIALLRKEDLVEMAKKVAEFCANRPDPQGLVKISDSVCLDSIAQGHLEAYSGICA